MSNLTDIIVAILTFIIGPSIVTYIKYRLDKKRDRNTEFTDLLTRSDDVNDKIEDIRKELKCDRVWITQFHNGGHFYPSGKSMAKFSIIYESLADGISSLHQSYQSLPVNMFSRPLGELLKTDVLLIYDVNDSTNYKGGIYAHSDIFSSHSQYLFSLKTLDGKFLGVLGVEYVLQKRVLSSHEVETLRRYSASIGAIMGGGLDK